MKRTSAALLLACALAACDHDPSGPLPGAPGAFAVAPDPEINRGDSYVFADLYVQGSGTVYPYEPFIDPATGDTRTSASLDEPERAMVVEAGFDAGGTSRINLHFPVAPDAEPGEQVTRIRVVGDAVTEFDGNGHPVMEALSSAPNPMALISAYDDGAVTEGLVTDHEMLFQPRDVAMSLQAADGAPERAVRWVASNRVEVSTTVAAGEEGRAGGPPSRITHVYEKRGAHYVLQEMRMEQDAVVDGRGARLRQVVRVRNVRWHKNPVRDRERRERRERRAAETAAGSARVLASLNPEEGCGEADNVPAGSECEPTGPDAGGGGTGGTGGSGAVAGVVPLPGFVASHESPAQAASGTLGMCGRSESRTPGHATGTSIVVQHGYMDNACSYSRFYTYSDGEPTGRVDRMIVDNFYFDQKIIPTLDSHARYDDQANALITKLDAHRNTPSPFVFVGFSNGGIVSRRVAHMRPDLVKGVVTVSTPHHGLPLMRNLRPVVGEVLRSGMVGLAVSCQIRHHGGCDQRARLQGLSSGPSPYGLDELSPVSAQMQPYTWFHSYLNGVPESFPRVGIEQHTRQRWALYRVLADINCSGPEKECGGRRAARTMDRTHKALTGVSILAGVITFAFPPAGFVTGVISGATAAAAVAIAIADDIWDGLTSPHDGSDGVVPNASQRYPNAPRREVITDADSHDAAKKSDMAITRIGQSLRRDMGVIPVPGGRF